MKQILIVLRLLLPFNAKSAYFQITNTSGTVAYGSENVTVTSTGSFTTWGGWCSISYGTSYWLGSSGPGIYTYTLSRPVHSIKVYSYALNGGSYMGSEYMQVYLNGVPYSLTSTDMTSYSDCGSGGPPCYLASGWLWGPLGSSTDYNGGDFVINQCADINSFEIYCSGTEYGVTYYVFVDTSGSCFSAANNGPICQGDTLKLRTSGGDTTLPYTWHGPGGYMTTGRYPVIPGATMADTGTYYVVQTISGVNDTAWTHVVIKPIPILIATSNSPICAGAGNILNLFASPDSLGETFSWSGPASFTSTLQDPTISSMSAADTGFYRVIANWNGCLDTAITHVILAPVPPAPIISGITTYCTGDVFVPFSISGATGIILWYTASTGGVGSSTPPVVNTSIGGVDTFWATQTILGCESLRDSIMVTVHVTPAAPVVSGASVYCQFDTYVPPSAAGTNILWYSTATGGVGSPTPPMINTSIPGTYVLYVTQSDSGCTSPRAVFTITVNPKPPVPVIVDTPDIYCAGQTFVPFTIVSGTGILWYTAASGGVGNPAPPTMNTSTTGTYTIWASQTVLGCESDRIAVSITVMNAVTSGFSYQVKWGCAADTVVFTNSSTGAVHYLWSLGDGNSSIDPNPVHIYTLQALDTVELMSSTASCLDSSKIIIDLRHPIQAMFTGTPAIICQNQQVTFTNTSVGTAPTYVWNFGDGTTSTTANPPNHYYPHTGVYTVTLEETDYVPCRSVANEIIYVDSISPIHIAMTDSVICKGTYITLTGLFSGIGNTGITWNLGNGVTVEDKNPLMYDYETTGTFTIRVTAHYRVCADTGTSRIMTIYPQPQINLGPDTTICPGSDAFGLMDHTNSGNGLASWEWNTGAKSAGIMITQAGIYIATVTIDGCSNSDSVTVKNDCYMATPNVFSPNGDGINDYFFPRQFLTSGLTEFKMDIYNRWGQLIFETTSLDGRGWDGRFNDIDQPEGVYIYLMDGVFKDGRHEHHQGNLTLLR